MDGRSIYRVIARGCLLTILCVVFLPGLPAAQELTLDEALSIAVARSTRAQTIRGDVEVAERNYFAKRINFYVPEVSLNGSLPGYSSDETFRFYGGLSERALVKTTDFNLTSNLQLKQNLITGGSFTARANLLRNESQYPLWSDLDTRLDELTEQGVFDFSLEQPLLKGSTATNELHEKRTSLELARVAGREEMGTLRKDVITAYFDVLQNDLKKQRADDQLVSAGAQARIDSLKMGDGVVPQETFLESAAAFLDAQLEQSDAENNRIRSSRDLAALLESETGNELLLAQPPVPAPLGADDRARTLAAWEKSTPVLKAESEYQRARKSASFTRTNFGISGNLVAGYSLGRGTVSAAEQEDEDIRTNTWNVGLNVTVPIWDGGAAGAGVRAAELTSDKARITLEQARKSARVDVVNLMNRIDVSQKKLEVLQKKIELAKNKLDIAEFRYSDGQISEVQLRKSRIDYHDARHAYLEELKKNYLDVTDLTTKYMVE